MNTWEKMIVQTTKHEISVKFFMFTAVPQNVMSRRGARSKIMYEEDSDNYMIIQTNSLCNPGLMSQI
jgi:hypothetical protein